MGGYSSDKHYEWEEGLVKIIQSTDGDVLTTVRASGMMKTFGGSEKTWKNRITDMKRKHGVELQEQNK